MTGELPILARITILLLNNDSVPSLKKSKVKKNPTQPGKELISFVVREAKCSINEAINILNQLFAIGTIVNSSTSQFKPQLKYTIHIPQLPASKFTIEYILFPFVNSDYSVFVVSDAHGKYLLKKALLSNEVAINKIKKEAVHLATLSNLSFIPEVKYYYQTTSSIILIQKFPAGGSLYSKIASERLTERFLLNLIVKITKMLYELHCRNLIYAHLNLGSIYVGDDPLTENSELYLVDTENLVPYEQDYVEDEKLRRISVFTSPEYNSSGKLTFSSDSWSIGVYLYYVLFGYPPYFASKPEILPKITQKYTLIMRNHSRLQEISTITRSILVQLLNPYYSRRLSAAEFLNWLQSNPIHLTDIKRIEYPTSIWYSYLLNRNTHSVGDINHSSTNTQLQITPDDSNNASNVNNISIEPAPVRRKTLLDKINFQKKKLKKDGTKTEYNIGVCGNSKSATRTFLNELLPRSTIDSPEKDVYIVGDSIIRIHILNIQNLFSHSWETAYYNLVHIFFLVDLRQLKDTVLKPTGLFLS